MLLNVVQINTATTTSFLTGDVNGPTLTWSDATVPTSPPVWSGVYV